MTNSFKWACAAGAALVVSLGGMKAAEAAHYNVVKRLSTTRLLVGGEFTRGGSSGAKNVMIVDKNGALPRGVTKLRANGEVHDAVVHGTSVYLVGEFTSINGQPRHGVAKIHRTTGALLPWTISYHHPQRFDVLGGVVSGGHLYIRGVLSVPTAPYGYSPSQGVSATVLRRYSLSNGAADNSWSKAGVGHVNEMKYTAVHGYGGGVYIGYKNVSPRLEYVKTGSPTVTFNTGPMMATSIARSGNFVYVAGWKNGSAHMRRYPAAGGNHNWEKSVGSGVVNGIAIRGNYVHSWGSGILARRSKHTGAVASVPAPSSKCYIHRVNSVAFMGSKNFIAGRKNMPSGYNLARCKASNWQKQSTFGAPF